MNETLNCLEQLQKNIDANSELKVDIFVVDDGSTDGTKEQINYKYPEVTIIQTAGSLFWSKSMYIGMTRALELQKYEFLLMVNDDVDFYDDMIENMFKSYYMANCECGIVGTTQDNGKATYGGRTQTEVLLTPNGAIQECFFANWNCFLLPVSVVDKLGYIDNHYQHAYGDYDYSYRMMKANIPIYVATNYVGRCANNAKRNTYADANVRKIKRLKLLFSPKGIPFYSYMRYNIKVSGVEKIWYYLYGYLSFVVYILLGRDI